MSVRLRCPKCKETLLLIKSDHQTEEDFAKDVSLSRRCPNQGHDRTIMVPVV